MIHDYNLPYIPLVTKNDCYFNIPSDPIYHLPVDVLKWPTDPIDRALKSKHDALLKSGFKCELTPLRPKNLPKSLFSRLNPNKPIQNV